MSEFELEIWKTEQRFGEHPPFGRISVRPWPSGHPVVVLNITDFHIIFGIDAAGVPLAPDSMRVAVEVNVL